MLYLISVVISGLIVGALARALIPGRQQISLLATAGIGIAGSVVGGIVGAMLFAPATPGSSACSCRSGPPPGCCRCACGRGGCARCRRCNPLPSIR